MVFRLAIRHNYQQQQVEMVHINLRKESLLSRCSSASGSGNRRYTWDMTTIIPASSVIVASDGTTAMLFSALFSRREVLTDLVTAQAPLPPAVTGRPNPNLYCDSLAFRVRVGCGGGNEGRDVDRSAVEGLEEDSRCMGSVLSPCIMTELRRFPEWPGIAGVERSIGCVRLGKGAAACFGSIGK